jgi:uncharacterized repeat protein (TIGR03803 family)
VCISRKVHFSQRSLPMTKFNGWRRIWPVFLLCVALVVPAVRSSSAPMRIIDGAIGNNEVFKTAPGGTLTTLHSFCNQKLCADGANPEAGLVQGIDGKFYGATVIGGTSLNCGGGNCGLIFNITSEGAFAIVHSFDGTDGSNPSAALVLATDGNLYEAVAYGGTHNNCDGNPGCGTITKMTFKDVVTTIHDFEGSDGYDPYAGLVEGFDGNLYGTTLFGGASTNCTSGCGTVFKITRSGTLITLHSFNSTDGWYPSGGLVRGTDGNFYGTTGGGGVHGAGTVFKITPKGSLRTMYDFCAQSNCADGDGPEAGLVQGTDGNFYGSTLGGGSNNCSGNQACGTVFRITPKGVLTTLHSFDGSDGSEPYGALVQGTDRNLYGTTAYGGASTNCSSGCGTVFRVTPRGGNLTTLYSFCVHSNCPDGAAPFGALVQGTDGSFYGTTTSGGTSSFPFGTVFKLSVGLGPFVKTLPTSGKVSSKVSILGNNLKGSTGVTFNGTVAKFTIVSNFEIKATVPSGATTGTVEVTTPKKTLKSNVIFRVTP